MWQMACDGIWICMRIKWLFGPLFLYLCSIKYSVGVKGASDTSSHLSCCSFCVKWKVHFVCDVGILYMVRRKLLRETFLLSDQWNGNEKTQRKFLYALSRDICIGVHFVSFSLDCIVVSCLHQSTEVLHLLCILSMG